MEKIQPIIQIEEPDKYGRDIKVGVEIAGCSSFLPRLSTDEAAALRDKLIQALDPNPIKATEEVDYEKLLRASVQVGYKVMVKFYEAAAQEKVRGLVTNIFPTTKTYTLEVVITAISGDTICGRSYRGGEVFRRDQIVYPRRSEEL